MPEDKSKEKLRKDVQRILDDIQELNKDLNETGEEIEETGEDVEEIKEDIEEIKEDIGTLRKAMSRGKEIFSKMATTVLPDKFAFKDLVFNIGLRIDRFDANQKDQLRYNNTVREPNVQFERGNSLQ